MQRFSKVFHVDTIPSYSLRPWRALRFIYLTAECAGTAKISAKALTPVPPLPSACFASFAVYLLCNREVRRARKEFR